MQQFINQMVNSQVFWQGMGKTRNASKQPDKSGKIETKSQIVKKKGLRHETIEIDKGSEGNMVHRKREHYIQFSQPFSDNGHLLWLITM